MQDIVIKSLLTNKEYASATIQYLDEDFFEGDFKTIFKAYKPFYIENNVVPTEDVMVYLLSENLTKKDTLKETSEIVKKIYQKPVEDKVVPYLVDKTEKWGLERSIYNAIVFSINEMESPDKNFGSVYDKIRNAVSYSFDKNLGMSYLDDAEERYNLYTHEESKYSLGLSAIDKATSGGTEKGTLNLFVAGSGGGKSIALVNVAVAQLLKGKNVLYITLEMAEHKIAERIDAKLMSLPVNEVTKQTRDEYLTRVGKLRNKTLGDIVIKQYPTSAASVLDFRHFINELNLKKDWKPDVLIVDYLGICADARGGKVDNTYTKLKHVAEDLRALGVEYQIPVFSAGQINRAGYGNSNSGMENIAESMGVVHTADMIISIYQNEELEESNNALMTFLKNRFGANDISILVGLNKQYMSFYDVDTKTPEFNHSQTGSKTAELVTGTFSQKTKEKSSNLKFG